MNKFYLIIFLGIFTYSLSANSETLKNLQSAFQTTYIFEEAAFDDTSKKVSYSSGNFSYSNSAYKILVEEPFMETYILTETCLRIIDNEFNQEEFLPTKDINNPFLSLLFANNTETVNKIIISNVNNNYIIKHLDFENPIELTLIENKIYLIKYIDHLNIMHIINFSES